VGQLDMVMDKLPLEAKELISGFFGVENKLELISILREDQGETVWVRAWINFLGEDGPGFTVLPRLLDDDITEWYGLAQSGSKLKELSENVMAFVGPTYSSFRGRKSNLDSADPVDSAVLAFTGGHAFRFRGQSGSNGHNSVKDALELMRRVWEYREARSVLRPKSARGLLRDFHMALAAGNHQSAESYLNMLQSESELDALNLLFLKIQMLSNFAKWNEILNLPELPDILNSRSPKLVKQSLIKAVYNSELAEFEAIGNVQGALDKFRDSVLPAYAILFRSTSGMNDPDVAKCNALFAAATKTPLSNVDATGFPLATIDTVDRQYLEQLTALLPDLVHGLSPDPLEAAREALRIYDFDQAFLFALRLPSSVEKAGILLTCAYEIASLESASQATTAIHALSVKDHEIIFSSRINKEQYSDLLGTNPNAALTDSDLESVPTDWNTLLRRLNDGALQNIAKTVALRGASEWSLDPWLSDPNSSNEFAELLRATRHPEADQQLHDCLPHILAFFQNDPIWPRQELLNIYSGLLDILAVSTQGGRDDLAIFNELLSANLELGVSDDRYMELTSYALELVDQYNSPSNLNWSLDLAEQLVMYPCPDLVSRQACLSSISLTFRKLYGRVDPGQNRLLKQLCDELELGGLFDESDSTKKTSSAEEKDAFDSYLMGYDGINDKTVAIYTLNERVAHRAKEFIQRCSPSTKIELSHDKVATQRLKHLATTADVFIVGVGTAKHSATNCIDQNRASSATTLVPRGNGTASIVRALTDHLSANT